MDITTVVSKRRVLWRWIFAMSILGLMATTAWSQLGQIRLPNFQLRWEFLIIAGFFLLTTLFCQLIGWIMIIRRLSPTPISFRSLTNIFASAWASRYVPFGVTPFVTKFIYGRRLGIGSTVLGMSMVLESILSAAAVFLVALLVYPDVVNPIINSYIVAVVAILAAGIMVWPQGLVRVSNWLLTRLKREPLQSPAIGWRDTSSWLLLYFFAAMTAGVGFYFLLMGLMPVHVPFTAAIGLLNAASFIGLITVIAPAGLGAREAALAGLLLPWFPWPVGVVIAASARLWTVAVDGIWLVGVWLVTYRSRRIVSDRS